MPVAVTIGMFHTSALAVILLAAPVLAVNLTLVQDAEDSERPAVLQFPTVTERDEVRVDGELVPPKGLARANYNLLIAPGEYVVAVKFAGAAKECESRVRVLSGQVLTPNCERPSAGEYARLFR